MEQFYAELYASNVRPGDSTETTNLVRKVPLVTIEETEKVPNKHNKGLAVSRFGMH